MTGLYFILFYFHALWQWVTGKIQKIYISPPCDSSSAVQCRAVQSQVPVLVEILTLLYVFNFRHKLTLLWKTLSIYIQDMFFSPQAPPRFLRIYGALSRPLGQKDSSCLRPSESFWPWGLLRAPYILRKLGGALWEINISTKKNLGLGVPYFSLIFEFWKFLQVFDISRGQKTFFSCEEAALEVQMLLCLSKCVSP